MFLIFLVNDEVWSSKICRGLKIEIFLQTSTGIVGVQVCLLAGVTCLNLGVHMINETAYALKTPHVLFQSWVSTLAGQ